MEKLWFLGSLLLIIACQSPEPQTEFVGEEQFRTTDPSLLYFKNVRSAYYYKEVEPHSKMDIYTFRKLSKTDDRPILYPKIINHWLKDEAYIFIEKGFYPYFDDTLRIQWVSDTLTGEHLLTRKTRQRQYEFAGELYRSLKEGHQMKMLNAKKQWVPIFKDYDDKSAFIMVMNDYYKLTEVR